MASFSWIALFEMISSNRFGKAGTKDDLTLQASGGSQNGGF